MAQHVQRGDMPGLIALLAHGDDVHVEVIGSKAFGDDLSLRRDAIFRIASMSKPIAALAAMVLVEDGMLGLDDPVDNLLPELAHPRVLRSLDADLDDTVPARRPITVEDLLTCKLGFGSIVAPPDTYPIQVAERERELATLVPPWPPTPHTPDEWIAELGALPLMHQPGEGWRYNTGIQVLGVLLERAADRPLGDVLRECVFSPLGMTDTDFSVPPAKRDRFTTAYAPDGSSGSLSVLDGVDDSYWSAPPSFPSAASWLVSTIDDYWAFVQVFRNDGRYSGGQLISPAAVTRMTTNCLSDAERKAGRIFLGVTSGWGLGMAASLEGQDPSGLPRGFGWDGGLGTTWRTDRAADLSGILLTQRAMSSPEPPEVFLDFWRCAYDAIEDCA